MATTKKKLPVKKTGKKPTLKQLKVVKEISENLGNKTKEQILLDAGYSESVAKTPEIVFGSKAILQAFHDGGLTDEYLMKKNKQLLEAHSIDKMQFMAGTEVEEMMQKIEENHPGARYISYESIEGNEGEEKWRIARFTVPDKLAQDKALDKAYKVKGSYAPEKHEHTGEISLLSLFKK